MDYKYCYRIKVTTVYQEDAVEEYLDGIYIYFDNAVDKADKVMRDMLEEINSDNKETEHGYYRLHGYWTRTYFKNHPKIQCVLVEAEKYERILG